MTSNLTPVTEYVRGRSREHEPPDPNNRFMDHSVRFMDALGRVWGMWAMSSSRHTPTTYELRTLAADPVFPAAPLLRHEAEWAWWNAMIGPMHEADLKPSRALEQPPTEDDFESVEMTEEDRRREARIAELADSKYETSRVKGWRWLLDRRHVGLLDISYDSKTEEARRAGFDVLAYPRPWPVKVLDPNVTVSRLIKPYDGSMNPLPEAQHLPVFDLDLPAYTIPSSTPGHTHLYINRPISTEHYQGILDALVAAGLVQEGFARRLHVDGYCTLRLPWVRKDPVSEPEPGQEPPLRPTCDTCGGTYRVPLAPGQTPGPTDRDGKTSCSDCRPLPQPVPTCSTCGGWGACIDCAGLDL